MIFWRAALLFLLIYAAMRLTIPFLTARGVPFEVRVALVALLPYVGWRLAPWLWRG